MVQNISLLLNVYTPPMFLRPSSSQNPPEFLNSLERKHFLAQKVASLQEGYHNAHTNHLQPPKLLPGYIYILIVCPLNQLIFKMSVFHHE